jgi:hypothetical protein
MTTSSSPRSRAAARSVSGAVVILIPRTVSLGTGLGWRQTSRPLRSGIAVTNWHGDEDRVRNRLWRPPTSKLCGGQRRERRAFGRASCQACSTSRKALTLARGRYSHWRCRIPPLIDPAAVLHSTVKMFAACLRTAAFDRLGADLWIGCLLVNRCQKLWASDKFPARKLPLARTFATSRS